MSSNGRIGRGPNKAPLNVGTKETGEAREGGGSSSKGLGPISQKSDVVGRPDFSDVPVLSVTDHPHPLTERSDITKLVETGLWGLAKAYYGTGEAASPHNVLASALGPTPEYRIKKKRPKVYARAQRVGKEIDEPGLLDIVLDALLGELHTAQVEHIDAAAEGMEMILNAIEELTPETARERLNTLGNDLREMMDDPKHQDLAQSVPFSVRARVALVLVALTHKAA